MVLVGTVVSESAWGTKGEIYLQEERWQHDPAPPDQPRGSLWSVGEEGGGRRGEPPSKGSQTRTDQERQTRSNTRVNSRPGALARSAACGFGRHFTFRTTYGTARALYRKGKSLTLGQIPSKIGLAIRNLLYVPLRDWRGLNVRVEGELMRTSASS